MSILTAIQEACPIIGLTKIATAVSTSDENAVRLLAFAHESGDDISRRGDWARMLTLASIPVNTTSLPLPADFERLVPGGAVYNSQGVFRGPLSSDQNNAIVGGVLGASSRSYYTIQNGTIFLTRSFPTEPVFVSYVRKAWMISADFSQYRLRAIADDDEILFPDRLLTKAVIWRHRRETGLQYEDQMAEWEADLAMHLRQDRGVTA